MMILRLEGFRYRNTFSELQHPSLFLRFDDLWVGTTVPPVGLWVVFEQAVDESDANHEDEIQDERDVEQRSLPRLLLHVFHHRNSNQKSCRHKITELLQFN